MSKYKAQLLLEVVLILGLITIILGIFASALVLSFNALRYSNISQDVTIYGFEKYRNALFDIAQRDFNSLNSLSTTTDYFLTSTAFGWQIISGKERVKSGLEEYFFSFRIDNFQSDPNVKLIKVTGEYQNIIFNDYFLLPKLNVNF
ncbi:MAG: hypothetical protein ACO2OW_00470 [Minisyncoccia bacterium]|jgi:hypothetical protein